MAVREEVASVMKKYLPHRSVSVFPIPLRRRFAPNDSYEPRSYDSNEQNKFKFVKIVTQKAFKLGNTLFFITTSCFSKDYLVICGGCY